MHNIKNIEKNSIARYYSIIQQICHCLIDHLSWFFYIEDELMYYKCKKQEDEMLVRRSEGRRRDDREYFH